MGRILWNLALWGYTDGEMEIHDEFYEVYADFAIDYTNFNFYMGLTIALGTAAAGLFLFALWGSGHKPEQEECAGTWQERIPLEFYLLLLVGGVIFGGYMLVEQLDSLLYWWEYGDAAVRKSIPLAGVVIVGCAGIGALVVRTITVRCKTHNLVHTTLILRLIVWVWSSLAYFVKNLPVTWKSVLAFLGYLGVIFFADYWEPLSYYRPLPGMCVNVVALIAVCWWSAGFRRIRKGTEVIASGNVNHKIDTTRLPGELREHAEALNNISSGLNTAVDEKMKSERFRTELITNVSHDIKTPLTSIINYVDLLQKEDIDNEKVREYLDVLDRQSSRLKKLIQDLLDASKASTGSINVELEELDAAVMLSQVAGEYKEKFEKNNLDLIIKNDVTPVMIQADGRHLWRVFDNLMNNINKYAQPCTRVYIDIIPKDSGAIITFKNVSATPLNISSDELKERFVRGDSSRNTEGSGLGLSIAESLMKLMNGTLELTVDGDLFKVTLEF